MTNRLATLTAVVALLAPSCKQHKAKKSEASESTEAKRISIEGGPGLPKYNAADITELDISHGDQRVIFRRRANGGWLMVRPLKAPADARAVEGALRELSRMEGEGHPATIRPDDWARYHVAPNEVVTIRTRAGSKELPVLHLGRKTWVRVGDSPAVFTAWHISYHTFARSEVRLWRDRTITRFSPPSVTAVEARYRKGGKLAARRAPGGTWKLTAGGDRIRSLNPDAVDTLVARLSNLMAHDAVAITPAEAGLDRPRLTLIFHRKDERDQLEIGNAKAGLVYLRSARSPQIWSVKEHVVAGLLRPAAWGK